MVNVYRALKICQALFWVFYSYYLIESSQCFYLGVIPLLYLGKLRHKEILAHFPRPHSPWVWYQPGLSHSWLQATGTLRIPWVDPRQEPMSGKWGKSEVSREARKIQASHVWYPKSNSWATAEGRGEGEDCLNNWDLLYSSALPFALFLALKFLVLKTRKVRLTFPPQLRYSKE